MREITTKVEDRYLPADVRGPELDELLWFEGRVGVEIDAGALARLGSGQGLAGSTLISTRSAGVPSTSALPVLRDHAAKQREPVRAAPNGYGDRRTCHGATGSIL